MSALIAFYSKCIVSNFHDMMCPQLLKYIDQILVYNMIHMLLCLYISFPWELKQRLIRDLTFFIQYVLQIIYAIFIIRFNLFLFNIQHRTPSAKTNTEIYIKFSIPFYIFYVFCCFVEIQKP